MRDKRTPKDVCGEANLHVDEPRAGSHALILIALRLVHLGLELKINYHTGFINNARTGWITTEINKINID